MLKEFFYRHGRQVASSKTHIVKVSNLPAEFIKRNLRAGAVIGRTLLVECLLRQGDGNGVVRQGVAHVGKGVNATCQCEAESPMCWTVVSRHQLAASRVLNDLPSIRACSPHEERKIGVDSPSSDETLPPSRHGGSDAWT